MEIEVVTTKKKLTKLMLSQMERAGTTQLVNGEVLGYLLNVMPDQKKTLLIKCDGRYYTSPTNFQMSANVHEMYRKSSGHSTVRYTFKTAEDRGRFLTALEAALIKATTQIYI